MRQVVRASRRPASLSAVPNVAGGLSLFAGLGTAALGLTSAFGLTVALGCNSDITVLDDGSVSNAGGAGGSGGSGPVIVTNGQLAAGQYHTCAIKNGELYCWGNNESGQLGQGIVGGSKATPRKVGEHDDWSQVSAGQDHTCGVRGGQAYCWGGNTSGQLGLGSTSPGQVGTPTAVTGLPGAVRSIEAAYIGTCALSVDGDLQCWGDDWQDGLGQGRAAGFIDPPLPVPSPGPTGAGTQWVGVALGDSAGCALETGGTPWCWGLNGDQGTNLALPNLPIRVFEPTRRDDGPYAQMVKTQGGGFARTPSGEIYGWGWNNTRQLGLDLSGAPKAPVKVPAPPLLMIAGEAFGTCGIAADGSLWCWGGIETFYQPLSTPTQLDDGHDFSEVAVGRIHFCALKQDYSVWCAGNDTYNQLGANAAGSVLAQVL